MPDLDFLWSIIFYGVLFGTFIPCLCSYYKSLVYVRILHLLHIRSLKLHFPYLDFLRRKFDQFKSCRSPTRVRWLTLKLNESDDGPRAGNSHFYDDGSNESMGQKRKGNQEIPGSHWNKSIRLLAALLGNSPSHGPLEDDRPSWWSMLSLSCVDSWWEDRV